MAERCACGWLRPLIGLTTDEGEPAPANVRALYMCPSCGDVYVPGEISPEEALRHVAGFLAGRSEDER